MASRRPYPLLDYNLWKYSNQCIPNATMNRKYISLHLSIYLSIYLTPYYSEYNRKNMLRIGANFLMAFDELNESSYGHLLKIPQI